MSDTSQPPAEQQPDSRLYLAVKRTELAWDRTLLAWLRTTSALIAAGFAFDKVTQYLHESRVEAGTALVRNGHVVGLSLTAASTLLLMFVCGQYWRGMGELASIHGTRRARLSPALVANGLLILLGVTVFFVLLPGTF